MTEHRTNRLCGEGVVHPPSQRWTPDLNLARHSDGVHEPFRNILFLEMYDLAGQEREEAPDLFRDLNLDQVVQAITAVWKDYDLVPFFRTPLHDLDTITYRQEVMRDLEDAPLRKALQAFSEAIRNMRRHLPQPEQHHYRYQAERCFLDATSIYCSAIRRFTDALVELDLTSRGLCAFRQYLTEYVASEYFRKLSTDAAVLASDLSAIRYCLVIIDL